MYCIRQADYTAQRSYDVSLALHKALHASATPPVESGKVCHLYRGEATKTAQVILSHSFEA
jgi:hypothetical protein